MYGRGARRKIARILRTGACGVCGVLWLGGSTLLGAGFSAPDPGVKAMGLGGAFVKCREW